MLLHTTCIYVFELRQHTVSALFAIKRDRDYTTINYVDKQVLRSSDMNNLDLDSVGSVSNLRADFTVIPLTLKIRTDHSF
jgi:hypothetical protein